MPDNQLFFYTCFWWQRYVLPAKDTPEEASTTLQTYGQGTGICDSKVRVDSESAYDFWQSINCVPYSTVSLPQVIEQLLNRRSSVPLMT